MIMGYCASVFIIQNDWKLLHIMGSLNINNSQGSSLHDTLWSSLPFTFVENSPNNCFVFG